MVGLLGTGTVGHSVGKSHCTQAKLWLDGGSVFDKKSGQFERIVLACTKKTLLQALTQLEAACRGRNSNAKQLPGGGAFIQ